MLRKYYNNNTLSTYRPTQKGATICMDLQDSVQRSLQNPAEKILQICTDSQRSKTWVADNIPPE